MGATRLVLPRELSLKEIKEIREAADVELETFIHGALCYCYSGQCLMSSLIGGRSGNRGRCAQTCRLPMNGRLLMNLKDICTLDILPQILDAGVVSLKIEGRMKSPRYAAGVVSVYRKYLDRLSDSAAAGRSEDRPPKANASSSGRWTVDPADRELLRELFDRGGFSEGYYRCHNGASMIAVNGKPDKRIPDEAMLAPLDRYLSGEITEAVKGRLVLRRGEPARLTVTLPSFAGGLDQGTFTHTALGQVPQTAQNRAATEADVRKQMAKTGGSGYTWSNLEIDMDDDLFLPVSVLNALRRDVFAGLSKEICDAYRRDD